MKAILLAAGLGTRLRPITNDTPKCLVKICNKPLLQWWIELLEKYHVDEVLINTHYLAHKVEEFITELKTTIKVNLFHEDELLGSGGTIRENFDFIRNEKEFYILYADNFTNINLNNFLHFHQNNPSSFSMVLFRSDDPKSCGIAQLNENDLIIDFEEKPQYPKSNLANAGVYLSSPSIIENIPNGKNADFGFSVLPKLTNRMYGWITDDYLIDIGSVENYKRANLDCKNLVKKSKKL